MKYILFFCILIISNHVHALGIKAKGEVCGSKDHSQIESKIEIYYQIGNFFSVRIEGGIPAQKVPLSLSPGTPIFCLDPRLGLLATDTTPKSINGYAVYAENTLYLFLTGINSLYPTQNAYIFSKSEDNYFYYVGNDSVGVLQGDGIRMGNLSPNSTLPKITDINLKYAVFQ